MMGLVPLSEETPASLLTLSPPREDSTEETEVAVCKPERDFSPGPDHHQA